MKTICFYFEIHQMFHLKRYRFFDINYDHYYFDDYANESIIEDAVGRSYQPAVDALMEMISKSEGQFKFALGVSGVALEMFEMHAPDFIEQLKRLADTGCVEFVAQPYSYGLSSVYDEEGFVSEVKRQSKKIKQLFGKTPTVFANTNMIYSDEIGSMVAAMGYKGVLTEGAKHILGWKSSHYLYNSSCNPNLSILFRDFKLSDDISLRFSNPDWNEYPLFADRYIGWIDALPQEEQIVNIFMDLSALGISQPLSSNILEFMKALPACAKEKGITFSTPTEIIKKLKPVSSIDIPYPISWCDEERDLSSWNGNVLQREALDKLYSIAERVHMCSNKLVQQNWDYLQSSDNFHMMSTKNTGVGLDRGIFDSPYDAFTNYMNIIADFISRVNAFYPEGVDNEELNSMTQTIRNQNAEIERLNGELADAQKKLKKLETAAAKAAKTAKTAEKKKKTQKAEE